jgi:hypothetical protein
MLKNVVICVLKDADTTVKVGLKLEKVLEDFRGTCGNVAELKIAHNNSIVATYVQDEHWSGFLSGVAYALVSGIKPV